MGTVISVFFRIIGGTIRWIVAGLTAWYRDGQTRMDGERAARWSVRDRIERWWSVGFFSLLLLWGASAEFTLPFVEDEQWSRRTAVAVLTILGVFVAVILARRIVVAVTHDPWTVQEMWADRLALVGIGLVAVTTPTMLLVERAVIAIEPIVTLMPLGIGVMSGTWHASVLLVDQRAKRQTLGFVRVAFGGSESEWNLARFRIVGKSLTIKRAPAAAFTDLLASEAKLSQVAPDWQIDEEASSASASRLILTRTTTDTHATRDLVRRSDGLVIGVADAARTPPRPDARAYVLAPGTSEAAYARVDALAQSEGSRVVLWEPEARRAIVARIDQRTATLRDTFASYMGTRPHEIELIVSADEDDRTERIDVVRYPRTSGNLDRLKRISSWRDITAATVQKIEGTRWIIQDSVEEGAVTIRRIDDILAKAFSLDDLHAQFPQTETDPAQSWKRFPIALREDGEPVIYTTFHTLCVGQTGAGKGSVVNGVIAGIFPAMRAGYAKVYAVDPKGAEAIANDGSERAYFDAVATTPDDWAALISDVAQEMDTRKGKGRKLDVREHPLILLFIDELSALSVMDTDSRRSGQVMADLIKIASQGRSLNVLILAAVQAPQKDMVGKLRESLGMRIALRTGTSLEADLVLGDGSVAGGAEAHLIPVANEGNNYYTAGIGYMRVDGEADPVRVRYPYIDDATLDLWDAEFRELRASGALDRKPTVETDPFGNHFEEPAAEPVAFSLDDIDPRTVAPVDPYRDFNLESA